MTEPTGAPERLGADVVLSIYVVTLLVLPSRYTIGEVALTASMLVAVLAGALWAAGFALGRPTVVLAEPAGRGLAAFVVVTLVGYTVTMLQPNEVAAVSAADRRLVATICALAAALLALDGLRSRAALERVLRVLVVCGGIMAAIGILQYAAGWDLARQLRLPGFGATGSVGFIFDRGGRTRVAGTMRHPIELGIMCAVLFPLALHLAVHDARRRDRRIAGTVAALLALALPMALSRAAVLAVAAGLAVLLWCLPRTRRRRLLGAGAIGLVLFVVVVPNLATTVRDLFTTDLAEGSNAARAAAADAALERFHEAPVLGRGLGATQDVIVDSQYLLTLAEIGIVGTIALVALWLGVVRSARATRRATDDASDRDLGAAFLAMITAIGVASAGFATLGTGATIGLVLLVAGLAGAHHRLVLAGAPGAALTEVSDDELVAPDGATPDLAGAHGGTG